MHEGDSRDGGAQIRPAEPLDRPAAGAGTEPLDRPAAGAGTGSLDRPPAGAGAGPLDRPAAGAGAGAHGWWRRGLTFLLVAALSAVAGVGATRAVQHFTASGPAATGMPGTAAADRQGSLNDEAVYRAVEPGVVDV